MRSRIIFASSSVRDSRIYSGKDVLRCFLEVRVWNESKNNKTATLILLCLVTKIMKKKKGENSAKPLTQELDILHDIIFAS